MQLLSRFNKDVVSGCNNVAVLPRGLLQDKLNESLSKVVAPRNRRGDKPCPLCRVCYLFGCALSINDSLSKVAAQRPYGMQRSAHAFPLASPPAAFL